MSPSEYFGIDHPLRRFEFDRKVYLFGSLVETLLEQEEKVGDKYRKKYKLKEAIREAERRISGKGKSGKVLEDITRAFSINGPGFDT